MNTDEKNVDNKKAEAALREEKISEFWKENKIFEKSLEQRKGKKEFVFYEGPPTANGNPGIHHLESRAFKDAIPRYKTMRGYHVRRKGGWDTHGLPVELQVEKKLGLNSKKAIEEYGIAKFNQECKESVWEYLAMWNKFTERIGYWVDEEHPYVTYRNSYIESVWNIVKRVDERKLLYKDYKVVPWCPRCGTALSSHELAQGYETVKDLSVYVKFRVTSPAHALRRLHPVLKGQEPPVHSEDSSEHAPAVFILAWTTTPWTLHGNVALAVGEKIKYTALRVGGASELLIVAKDRVQALFKDGNIEIVHDDISGRDLVGLEYEPLYPYLKEQLEKKKEPTDKMSQVYAADFVNTEDGTGIVHTAVMYGQDDFELGTKVGLPKHHLVGLDGKFLPGTGPFEGRFVKDEEVAVDIIKDLSQRGLLYAKEKYEHSYPHCWRCKTPLIYYARDSWYIRMSDPKVKGEMIEENKDINWEPAHIREGRFGEWLREIKDWAISRERYWGTPLPVWQCESCDTREIIGSIAELKTKTKKSGNKYFVMRHGEAENNVLNICSADIHNTHHLTEKGKLQVAEAAHYLVDKNINAVFVSPFLRTQETARIALEKINFPFQNAITDARLVEVKEGIFEGKPGQVLADFYKHNNVDRYDTAPEGGESVIDVKKRIGAFIEEVDQKHKNENILIITHSGAAQALFSVLNGFNKKDTHRHATENIPLQNAEIKEFEFISLPHNEQYELDLHRPYIDDVNLACECGNNLVRAKEVMDVWFDSGAMPFAQDHYPFDFAPGKPFEGKELMYPADYISEAIDQTRGWFYTLHAIGILMGRGKAYRNVICLGHLLDSNGKKMSKSLGNIVDPWIMMDKYGVDTLRLWMYSVNQPGESKNFDEKTVLQLQQQVFGLLYNVLFFYELYRNPALENNERPKSQNVLDIWVLGKLDALVASMTENMDAYKLLEPVRALREFIGDLSTWYVRRSRERIKEADDSAKRTLYFVLKTLAKLLAPFAPFAAEDIWQRLRREGDTESVHLERWPARDMLGKMKFVFEKGKIKKVLLDMETVRNIVSQGLKERQMKNLPVRQPLRKLTLKITLPKNFKRIVEDELNIKKIEENKNLAADVAIDPEVTPELKAEGNYRELVRALQDLRKKIGLTPADRVTLGVDTDTAGRELIQKFETDLKKTVLVSEVVFAASGGSALPQGFGEEIKIDNLVFRVKIGKIEG